MPFQNLDEPGPPRNFRTETVTKTSISVKWEAPTLDGNRPITNYTVIYKLEDSEIKIVYVTNNTSITLIDLNPSKTYVIIVFANNNHFSGSPNQIKVVTADAGAISNSPLNPFLPSYKDGNYLCWCSFMINFRDTRNDIYQYRLSSIYVLVK